MNRYQQDILAISGWLTEAEASFLFETAKTVCSPDVIVEIGSWKGKSTICLAGSLKEDGGVKVYAIDPHVGSSEHEKLFGKVDTYEDFLTNIKKAGVKQQVVPIRKASVDAAKKFHHTVGFLFVDGAHEFNMVEKDIAAWFSKVNNGGTIAFHDSWHFLGPNLATAKMLVSSSKIRNPRLIDTITSFQKVAQNSLSDRLFNMLFLCYRTIFGWIGAAKIGYKDSVALVFGSLKK